MKYIASSLAGLGLLLAVALPGYASDWDKAGKILTGIEAVRILTGGNVDIIGSMTGVKPRTEVLERQAYVYRGPSRHSEYNKIWVPNYVWIKEYVPRHTEYVAPYGKVLVEGHYVTRQVESGSHWEYTAGGDYRGRDNDGRSHRDGYRRS
jgi:hypothetical protein